jgi:hypothetical protein
MALSPTVVLNGPWVGTTATALDPNANGAASQDSYSVDFYAGENSTVCGAAGVGGTSTNAFGYSSGSNTNARWTAKVGGSYATPASLGNEAEGGSVAVTLTMNYEG